MDNVLVKELYEANMITQNGEGIISLAKYLLTLEKGDRLFPKRKLARTYKVGVGTIQSAFKKLEEARSIQLLSKGHLGTFIEDIDKNILWKYSMYGYIRGTMPLPYSNVLIGMATGIYSCFPEDGPMLKMSYRRGSKERIQDLCKGRDDFTICSIFSAKKAMEKFLDLTIYLDFDDNTYMGKPAILLRKGIKLSDGIKIGVDQSSYDQDPISKIVFKDYEVEYIKIHYDNLFYMLEKGFIDGCIWSLIDLKNIDFKGTIKALPENLLESFEGSGQAVILITKKNVQKMNSIRYLFDKERIQTIQKNVKENKEIPNY